MMKKVILPLLALLTLCSCLSPEEMERERIRLKQERLLEDTHQCMSYGFERGTDEFAKCMMEENNSRRKREEYRKREEDRERREREREYRQERKERKERKERQAREHHD